jgi:hypothetical protein
MSKRYKIRQGECISSISLFLNMPEHKIRHDQENEEVVEKRSNLNALMPGDILVIPDHQKRVEHVASDKRHVFQKKGCKVELRLCLLDWLGEPRSNQAYRLVVDMVDLEGETDEVGELTESIPSEVQEGTLYLVDSSETIELLIGHLDAIEEVSGVQARLENLDYDVRTVDNEFGSRTQENLRRFQSAEGLSADGELNDQTRLKLTEVHGG